MRTLFFIVVGAYAFFTFIPLVRAEDVLLFHFNKNSDTLTLDSDLASPIVLEDDPSFSVVTFSKENVQGEYRIEFSDITGASAVQYEFFGQNGKFSQEFPHFGIVNGYRVYSVKTGKLLFEGSLANFTQCNASGICEFEKGENINTCLTDCTSGNFSDETKKLLKQNNDVIRDPKSGEILLRGIQANVATPTGVASTADSGTISAFMLVGGIAVVLISIGVIVLMRLRARNKRYGL